MFIYILIISFQLNMIVRQKLLDSREVKGSATVLSWLIQERLKCKPDS